MTSSTLPPAGRRGIALALTLLVLVIVASLLTVAVYLGFQDQRASGTGRRLHHALTDAEGGLVEAAARREPALLSRLLPQALDSLSLGGTDWRGSMHRLNPGLFLIEIAAANGDRAPSTLAVQTRLGWVVRTHPVDVPVSAALTAGGLVMIGDGAAISGQDRPPDGWADCAASGPAVAGVEAESVLVEGTARLEGSPPILRRSSGDSGLTPSQRRVFDRLAATPTISLPGGSWFTQPVLTGTRCDGTPDLNWGDPSRPEAPCGGYLPIVHVAGDAMLSGGTGQGILLVEGDLVIRGPYRYSGIVLVTGTFDVATPDSGVTLEGAVVAARTGFATHSPAPFAITYSACRVARALQTSGTLVPLRSRGWKQLF